MTLTAATLTTDIPRAPSIATEAAATMRREYRELVIRLFEAEQMVKSCESRGWPVHRYLIELRDSAQRAEQTAASEMDRLLGRVFRGA